MLIQYPRPLTKGDVPYDLIKIGKGAKEIPIYSISSFHDLTQVIGYVKFLNRDNTDVYFRGQTNLYDTLPPSLYRGIENVSEKNKWIKEFIKKCRAEVPSFRKDMDSIICEPLLQHYGMKTRWLDLVDNIWVALWFCLQEYKTILLDRPYSYVYTRKDLDGYGYIILVCSDAKNEDEKTKGVYRGTETIMVDLRKAAPSFYIRPHSQHAVLMKSYGRNICKDFYEYVPAIIKIKVSDIIEWIGNSRLLSVENFYPSPIFDKGYGFLLQDLKLSPMQKNEYKSYGGIVFYSAEKN